MARKRIKTKITGLVAHVTPNATRHSKFHTELSIAMIAYSKGDATEEQMQILKKAIKAFKDNRLTTPTRIKRGIPTQQTTIFGKTFELTKEDMAELKEYHDYLERVKDDKALELLTWES